MLGYHGRYLAILLALQHSAGGRFFVGAAIMALAVGALERAMDRGVEWAHLNRGLEVVRGFLRVAFAQPGLAQRGVRRGLLGIALQRRLRAGDGAPGGPE